MLFYFAIFLSSFLGCFGAIYFYHKYKFVITMFDDITDNYQNKVIFDLNEENPEQIIIEDYHPTLDEIIEAKYAKDEF